MQEQVTDKLLRVAQDCDDITQAVHEVLIADENTDVPLTDGTTTPSLSKRVKQFGSQVTKVVDKVGEVSAEDIANALELGTAAKQNASDLMQASNLKDKNGDTQQEVNDKQEEINRSLEKMSINIDMFKTASNTDADAMYLMFAYAKENNSKSLIVNRDISLDRKITLTQDDSKYLNDVKLDFWGNVHYTGAGANSLYIGIMEVLGALTATATTVVGDHAEYTSDLDVASASGFAVGDYILIRSTAISKPDVYLNHIARIDEIVGNKFQTDTIRRLAVNPSIATVNVTKLNAVHNFSIDGNPMFTADNQTSRANGIGAVQQKYCVGGTVDISCKGLWFKGIATNQCARVTSICKGFDPAATGGGEGYSVQHQYTTLSLIKGASGHNMRHTTDMTCSWWCNVIDATDDGATASAFIHHCAYEFGINYIRCVSNNSKENGFNFGIVSGAFGDYSDRISLIDCDVDGSARACVQYANKGKGLTIKGGTYKNAPSSTLYSIITSNNDTTIENAKLLSGIQVTTSDTMNTSGYTVCNNCEINEGVNSRGINLTTGRTLTINGGKVDGRHLLWANSTLRLNNVDTMHFKTGQTFSRVSGGANVAMYASGGSLSYQDDSTVSQNIDVDILDIDGATFRQTQTNRVTTANCGTVRFKNLKGTASFASNGNSNKDFTLANSIGLSTAGVQPLLNMSAFSGKLNIMNCQVLGNITVSATAAAGTLNMQGNTVTGNVNIADTTVAKAICSMNIISGTATLPVNNGTTKIVGNNVTG